MAEYVQVVKRAFKHLGGHGGVRGAILQLLRHRWLHSMTDDPPTTHPPVARKFIWENHEFNLSGTPRQYVPYSTTRKKIQEWIPPTTASK
ncbi:UNVERIFIED_CONTAM: hypothetical protein H355_002384 [Colinus virginianus]|uniref:NADH dehydrogenase [ubiquinone] 1 alpha subcomplex subunit 12 n=1 Tax=Callipepla squamata TaxID=9009 RepID=A0A226MXW0_CALSU|nr:hypothetical protein ASZ78_012403 [Callipepla squamata]OXB76913.1 hypothetical protein H355_002384 [Colinus virginianus]